MGSGRPALLGAPRTHRRTSGPLSCAGGFMRPVSPGGPLPDFTGTLGRSPQSSVVPLGPESPRPRVLSVGRMWGPMAPLPSPHPADQLVEASSPSPSFLAFGLLFRMDC